MYEIEKFFGHRGTVATLVAVNFGHCWGDFIKSSKFHSSHMLSTSTPVGNVCM